MRSSWIGLSLLLLWAGCRSEQTSGLRADDVVSALRAISDTLTSGIVGGAPLLQPAVLAADKAGKPVARVWIHFSVVLGEGSVTPDSARTDASGTATANWILGRKAGLQQLSASTARKHSLTFSASAAPGPPASLTATTATEQTGVAGTVLEYPATARVADAFGNPLPGLSVTFVLPLGSGSLSDSTGLTDVQGEARTFWRLSAIPGQYELRATTPTLAPVVFQAHAVDSLRPNQRRLATGGFHTCSLGADSRAYCWGDNYWGQLGAGGFHRTHPVPVLRDYSYTAIDAGGTHTCGISADQGVYCWGSNLSGQAGWSLDAESLDTPQPVALPGKAIDIATGAAHSCALLSDRAVYCWGDNSHGQLGDGTGTGGPVPVRALSGNTFVAIDAGDESTCALSQAGEAFCWGGNRYGQLGDGTETTRTRPVRAAAGHRFRSVSIARHACGITLSDNVLCWGDNADGALGYPSPNNSLSPVSPAIIGRVVSLATGLGHSCAIDARGAAYCWGRNWYGQVGDGTMTNRSIPVLVSSGASFVSIAASWAHSCAARADGLLQCWGSNTSGQLGDGTGGPRSTPEVVPNIGPVKAISVGGLHTCGVELQGPLRCWGFNDYERDRFGIKSMRASQVAEVLTASVRFDTIALGALHGCGLTNLGTIWCWGTNRSDGQKPAAVAAQAFFKQITLGTSNCALATTDEAYCWGDNGYGQLGDGTTVSRTMPTGVAGDLRWTTLSTGWAFTCGISVAHLPYCWGFNGWGQLGDNTRQRRSAPTPVVGGHSMVSIAAGGAAACGVTTTGDVYCWGDNTFGQLGDGAFKGSYVPQRIAASEAFASVTGGIYHFCALTRAGAAYCWGANNNGQLGLGYESFTWRTPQPVVGGHRFVSLSAAGFVTARATGTTCGLRTDATVLCWGSNSGGQLGNGKAWSAVPITVTRP